MSDSNEFVNRQWCRSFFPVYNRRPYEGLALFAPQDVYIGRVDAVLSIVAIQPRCGLYGNFHKKISLLHNHKVNVLGDHRLPQADGLA